MTPSTVEELASQCLERIRLEGEQAIDGICAEHPEHAERIRGMVRQLLRIGLVEEPAPDVPAQIGDYRVLRRLGGGGMGVVYLAEQTSLGRRVALKLMRPGFALHGRTQERFRREITAISRLDHPGICTVYEAGEASGMPYLAMRYIEGESLAMVLARRREETSSKTTSGSGSRDLHDTVQLVEKVACAVHAAHEAGLVHRDIKPANVMIERDGQPVVLDFGLARAADDGELTLTASGERIGTPVYMAPEQVSGKPVDRRTDVYALGVTLYECLTLTQPFESSSRENLYREILSVDAPDPRSRNRQIGAELRVVLAKSMDKAPARRFATALELADELRRIRTHEPILTRRPGFALRTLRWSQRNRTASGVLAAALVGLAVSLWFLRQSQLSGTRFRALALLERAGEVEARSPELAFKLAREALRLSPSSDPTILARIQQIMFQLRAYEPLLSTGGRQLTRALHSPSGRHLVIAGPGTRAALFDEAGKLLWRCPKSSSVQFPAVAFSPDEEELAIAWNDEERGGILRYDLRGERPEPIAGSIQLWQAHSICYRGDDRSLLVTYSSKQGLNHSSLFSRDGTLVKALDHQGRRSWFTSGFLPDGSIVAAGRLWDRDGNARKELDACSGIVWGPIGIPVTEDRFLVCSTVGEIRVYSHAGTRLGGMQIPVESDSYLLEHAEFDPAGERIVTGQRGGWIRFLDGTASRTLATRYVRHTVLCVRFSPDGERIAAGDWTGTVRVWDRDYRDIDRIKAHESGIGRLGFSPLNDSLVTTSWAGESRRWSLGAWPGVGLSIGTGWAQVAASPSGDRVAVYSETSGQLSLHGTDGTLLESQPLTGTSVFLDFPREEEVVVGSGSGQRFYVWDLGENVLRPFEGPERMFGLVPRRVAGDRWLVQCAPGMRAVLWRAGGAPPEELAKDLGFISAAWASADGQRILVGSQAGRVRMMDPEGRTLAEFGPVGLVNSLRLSKDQKRVLIASDDNRAWLWDLESGTSRSFADHQNGVLSARFSPDEKRIVTSAKDGWVRIFDVATGEALLRLEAHDEATRSFALTRSRRLVSAGADGTIRWWLLDGKELLAKIDTLGIPELSDLERQRFADVLK